MIRLTIRYTWTFILLILFQVLILNNLHLSIFINPYVYILLILILPFDTPGWLSLSLAFLLGLTMDAFSNTPGMHSAATVFLAFIRLYLLRIIAPRDGYESGSSPHYSNMGLTWFILYAGMLIILHHIFLFFVEDFRMDHFFSIFFKAVASTILSLVIMLILLLVSYKPSR